MHGYFRLDFLFSFLGLCVCVGWERGGGEGVDFVVLKRFVCLFVCCDGLGRLKGVGFLCLSFFLCVCSFCFDSLIIILKMFCYSIHLLKQLEC